MFVLPVEHSRLTLGSSSMHVPHFPLIRENAIQASPFFVSTFRKNHYYSVITSEA